MSRETKSDLAYTMIGSVSSFLRNLRHCAICEKKFNLWYRGIYECTSCMKCICSSSSCTAKERWPRSKFNEINLRFRAMKKTYRVCTLCATEEKARENRGRLDEQSLNDTKLVYTKTTCSKNESTTATKENARAKSPLLPVYTSSIPNTPHITSEASDSQKFDTMKKNFRRCYESKSPFLSPSSDDSIVEMYFNFWGKGSFDGRKKESEVTMTFNPGATGWEESKPAGFSGEVPATPKEQQ